MRYAKVPWPACGAALAVVLITASTVWAQQILLEGQLFATPVDPTATGQAVWSLDTDNGERQLTITLQDVQSTYLAHAFVNGRFVGFIMISGGSGQLALDNFDGDAVPRAAPGSPVVITNADQVTILQGTLNSQR
jgi:hypothetical protein